MNNLLEQSVETMDPAFIFIDGSYYNFHRYYAVMLWWKNAYPDEPLDDPYKNEAFVEKFKKTHIENLKQMTKKLKINKETTPILIVGKDCKRENIWRNEIFSQYKANRPKKGPENGFMGGPFFKMAYEEELFIKGGAKAILKHPRLEADDCIAISVKHLVNKYPNCCIYIITSDRDYLQLTSHNVKLYNLTYKNLTENNGSTGDQLVDLEIKIIMGDTSDNIPSVFPKCGPKTALKCIVEPEFFKKKMNENPKYYNQYKLNQQLVNFDNIPKNLVEEFMKSIKNGQ